MSLASWIAALFGRKPAPATSPEPKLMIETPPVMVDAPAVDDPVTTLADTLWMEARGDGKDGMQAVANVICNRANNPRVVGQQYRRRLPQALPVFELEPRQYAASAREGSPGERRRQLCDRA